MPVPFSDFETLLRSVTESKIPAGTIAFMIGVEQGAAGQDVRPDQQAGEFERHGVRITEDTVGSFNAGSLFGRLLKLARSTRDTIREEPPGFGGGGSFGGPPPGDPYDDRDPRR